MLAEQRAQAIIELINQRGFQTIDALAGEFGVSPQTIRRDVNSLNDQGLLRRRHGGAESPQQRENLTYPARQQLNLAAKRLIAQRVAQDVPERASLFIGIGTTPELCALALLHHPQLRVMTNNLNAVMRLARNLDCDLVVAGGRVRNLDLDVVAGEAHDFFSRFSVDIGIFGVGAVAPDGTLLDFSLDEVAMRQSLMRHCRQRFLVLDHSKFERDATVRGGHITDSSAVYSDRPLPPSISAMLATAGVRIVVPAAQPPVSPTPGEQA